MNHRSAIFSLLLLLAGSVGRAQDVSTFKEDWKPASTNQQGKEYPQVNSERRIRFRVVAPQAQSVSVTFRESTPFTKDADGVWTGYSRVLDEGFHYYMLKIDGAEVPDPNSLYYFGAGRWGSAIEIPAGDQDFYALKNVPHGQLREIFFHSKSTNSERRAFVYTPPDYDQSAERRYPVLYLQHGYGENEYGWGAQGHAGRIMDNLIAEGKAKPFIIVMTYGMTNEIRSGGMAEFRIEPFQTVLIDELIPYVDAHFRTLADQPNRAMAGLSMGGMETRTITLKNLSVFSHIGLFSGGSIAPADIADMAAFKEKNKLVFVSYGSREIGNGNQPRRGGDPKAAVEALKAAGVNSVFYVSPDTAHEWQSWRRSLKEMAPLLFQPAAAAGAPAPTAAPARPAPVESPRVNADRTVTFRLRAPSAQKVELSGQFLKGNQPMQQDDAGVWSITVGPVEPNLYPYNFVVDGAGVADPANPDVFPNERFKPSLVDVPGAEPSLHSLQSVPHGAMTYCYYESKTLQQTRPLVIYTPPGYQSGTEKYPVFYLVSGTTDTEETWFRAGRMNFILDNLLAQKKAVPMIVVTPYGNMNMDAVRPSSPEVTAMYQKFNDELVGSIMPFVESSYRVLADREKRAIAGFSRGGGQSLFTAFNNPDKFAWIGSYAAYLTPEACARHFPALTADPGAASARLKLLWLGVGTEDFLHQPAVQFHSFLKEKGINHTWLETGGGHTWMNARHYLAETLQLLFK